MSQSYTITESSSFTVTHAKHIAAKVATDLKRMQRFYGYPSDAKIAAFEAEIITYLKAGYLGSVSYGFKRGGDWIEPMLRYTARELSGTTASDNDPGRVRPGAATSNAVFHSYLTHNFAWNLLSPEEQAAFEKTLPFQRTGADEPGIDGYLSNDRTYSSGGRALERASVRSYR
ncbi:MAG: hypothetical protein WBD99_02325 [Thermodesulfobacteriota bacterium]